ncbi:hypothetical protein H4R26_002048 [Coemansia thaxteri]|uniref:SS18 N-terminal domain-containing protein n=1 Tax=Coemansia thaxteri TaxID=2663907 RepID=A0A9W8EIT4_9FUNG|nr:hypothetical protein H4R26_002048 [Coemansia thaxteri]KAJ2486795.1 hypothetical protein EV174_000899 [Coemansia sp. RSA 2320]
MDDSNASDAARDSDIDVILDDDQSESGEYGETDHAGHIRRESEGDGAGSGKRGDKEKKSNQIDDEPVHPYLPRLKTSIIQMVLGINAELLRLCQEYQNNSLMDDPQLVMYQMRLQSNLAYLASVADHFLDPTRSMPDLAPLPKPKLPECQGSSIVAKLAHAREVYAAYVSAWSEQQMELSKRAKSKLHEKEKAQYANVEGERLHERVEELLKSDRVLYDKSGDEPVSSETFKPFPPFKIPEETHLPPGLQRWTFDNSTATPQNTL